jgi:DNA-binding NarL/FixJ family response regulator
MPPVRVVVADDHALVRAGIRAVLAEIPGVVVVGEADSGQQALTLIEQHHPDIAFIDISMGEMSGLEVTTRVGERFPDVRVIIISMYAHEAYVEQALRAGARGYLLKDSATSELHLALDAARRGETYLSPAISRTVVSGFLGRPSGGGRHAMDTLTPRQREILTLLATGRSTKEIAGALNLSVKTVESHRAEVMRRLDIHDLPTLVMYALHVGLIPPVD